MVQEISLGSEKLYARSGKPKNVDSEAMLQAIDTNVESIKSH